MKHPRSLLPLLLLVAVAAPLSAAEAPAAEAPAATTSAYPLTTCVVSGEALGSMGDAYIHVYKEEGKPDREVRLCCKGCVKKFTKEPAKYLAKLDVADAAKPADAATTTGHAH